MENTEKRVNKMAEWAKTVNDQLAQLKKDIGNQPGYDVTEIEIELAGLYKSYQMIPQERFQKTIELIDIEQLLSGAKEDAQDMYDAAYLDVSMLVGDKGKLTYTNETLRKSAAKKALAGQDAWEKIQKQISDLEKQQRIKRAELTQLDDLEKEYSRRNRALVARIDYVSAMAR